MKEDLYLVAAGIVGVLVFILVVVMDYLDKRKRDK